MKAVCILSLARDIHALAVVHELRQLGQAVAHVPMDELAARDVVSVRIERETISGRLRDVDGVVWSIAEFGLVWCRRINWRVHTPEELSPTDADLVRRDCRAAVLGALLCDPGIRFVNHPQTADRAESKLVQLATAARLGFLTPRTLISQECMEVKRFMEREEDGIVAKPVAGTPSRNLLTVDVEADALDDENVLISPTIFQQRIAGTRHLRICVFGDDVIGFSIQSDSLDWRPDGGAQIAFQALEPPLASALVALHDALGLRMGIVDMKLNLRGEPVFLETNQQGQFLFCEAPTGVPLARRMAEFLVRELNGGRGV